VTFRRRANSANDDASDADSETCTGMRVNPGFHASTSSSLLATIRAGDSRNEKRRIAGMSKMELIIGGLPPQGGVGQVPFFEPLAGVA